MRRYNFDTQVLRSLITIVDAGSFAAAADQLNMTQPAISQQMRKLDDMVGQPLFRKDGRRLVLTNAGELLVNLAREIIELNDRIPQTLGMGQGSEVVHIGMPEHFSEALLPVLMARAHAEFPNVQLVVKVGRSRVLTDALTEGRLHMALAFSDRPTADEVSNQVVPMSWLGAQTDTPEPLPDTIPLVLFRAPCDFRAAATKALTEHGLRWQCAQEGEDLLTLRAAVKAKMGITALPVLQTYQGLNTLSPDLPSLPDMTVRLRRSESWTSKAKGRFTDMVDEVWRTFRHAPAA